MERVLCGWIDLSSGVRLKFTGGDRVRYLNGQVSNDVRKLTADSAMDACVLNHKGRLEATISLTLDAHQTAILVDGPPDLREALPQRLEKYIIADDVVMTDVTAQTALLHFPGLSAPTLPPSCRAVAHQRFGVPGWDVWLPPDQIQNATAQTAMISPEEVEWLRIDRGVPAWGRELDPQTLPAEAGLDRGFIDYQKGCYLGQEIVSRLKSVGQVRRLLHRLTLEGGSPPETSWALFCENGSCFVEVGRLTSFALPPPGGGKKAVALGYLRREGISASDRIFAGPDASHLSATFKIRNT